MIFFLSAAEKQPKIPDYQWLGDLTLFTNSLNSMDRGFDDVKGQLRRSVSSLGTNDIDEYEQQWNQKRKYMKQNIEAGINIGI